MNVIIEKLKNKLININIIRYYRRRKNATGVFGDEAEVEKLFNRFSKYLDFNDKVILELGPGQTYEFAEKIKHSGANGVYIIDVERYFTDSFLQNKGLHYKIYDGKLLPYEDNFFDIVCSNNVYEHLRYETITVEETNRVLRKGGICLHQIDLRDHFCFDENNERVFNMLRYNKEDWWNMTSNRVSYVNRLRMSHWVELHEKCGFHVSIMEKNTSNKIIELYNSKSNRINYLLALSFEDATTSQILLKAVKE